MELIDSLSKFFVTMLIYRRQTISHVLQTIATVKLSREDVPSGLLGVTDVSSPLALLSDISCRHILEQLNGGLECLLGRNGCVAALETAQTVSRQCYEQTVSELLGVAVPADFKECASNPHSQSSSQQLGGLATAVVIAEKAIIDVATANKALHAATGARIGDDHDGNDKNVNGKQLANVQALKDIRDEVHKDLWSPQGQGNTGTGSRVLDVITDITAINSSASSSRSRQDSSKRPIDREVAPETTVPNVVQEVNALMQQQRIDQTAEYLEILNIKASRKKKALHSLLKLWESAKLAGGGNKLNGSLTASQMDNDAVRLRQRLIAMPVADIVAQTRDVQQLLVNDMQDEPSTRTSQVCFRIVQYVAVDCLVL